MAIIMQNHILKAEEDYRIQKKGSNIQKDYENIGQTLGLLIGATHKYDLIDKVMELMKASGDGDYKTAEKKYEEILDGSPIVFQKFFRNMVKPTYENQAQKAYNKD